jgi:hypothetical protein
LDGASVWLSGLGLSVWQLEGCIAIFAVISLLLIWRFWVNEKASSQAHLVEAEPASELEKS